MPIVILSKEGKIRKKVWIDSFFFSFFHQGCLEKMGKWMEVTVMPILLKRAYEEAASNDGHRVLIDRMWPRGLTKEKDDIIHVHSSVDPTPALIQFSPNISPAISIPVKPVQWHGMIVSTPNSFKPRI